MTKQPPFPAAYVLARYRAMRLIKQQIKAEGRIKGPLPQAVLNRLAAELLEACPHLVAAAATDPIVVQMSQVAHRRRTVGRKDKSLFTTHVQNGS